MHFTSFAFLKLRLNLVTKLFNSLTPTNLISKVKNSDVISKNNCNNNKTIKK